MKQFFNIKRIIYLSIICVTFLTLIFMLIFPIGVPLVACTSTIVVYDPFLKRIATMEFSGSRSLYSDLLSPFTLPGPFEDPIILIAQTIVFPIVGVIFLVFLALFLVELKRAGIFNRTHRTTKAERMQAQIDELQKQVDELKKED